jgi:hypothetical protein
MATLAGRPSSSYRLRAPVRAAPQRWRPQEQWPERPGVAQFLYLSILLHGIAILLFGAPPGGSRDGRAMWGSLNVTIQAAAKPIALPERMEPIAATPLLKVERSFAPRPIVTPQVVVPPKMERIAPPQMKIEKMLPAPKIEVVPVPVRPPPVAVPAPISPIIPDLPRVERTLVEPPKLVAPLAQPVAPPVKERAPPPVEIPRIETPLVPSVPAAPALPAMERAPEIAPKLAAPPPVEPPAPTKAETPAVAAPDAPMSREELFAPRVPAPAASPAPPPPRASERDYDPTKPGIDPEEMRRRASQMAREGVGQRALLPFPMPAPPERKTRTEEALDKARKPDCRTAYQDLGLLAAVPLLANEFGEGTCRW